MLAWATSVGAAVVLCALKQPLRDAGLPSSAGSLLSIVTAGTTLTVLGRRRSAWQGTRWLGAGFLLTGTVMAGLWVATNLGFGGPGPRSFGIGFAMALIVALGAVVIDCRDHARQDAVEITSDVVLLAALTGGGVYLLLRSGHGAHGSLGDASLTAAIATASILLFSAAAVLTLWCPTRLHMALFGPWTLLAAAGIWVAWGRQFDVPLGIPRPHQLLATVALAALTGVLVIEPRAAGTGRPPAPAMWARPWLLSLSLGGACVWLGTALLTDAPGADRDGGAVLVAGVAALVALRTLGNQRATSGATRKLAEALAQREEALASLHDAAAEIARSEARLRLLVEAAVDGVVELGPDEVVLRANDAFCGMIGLPSDQVVGRRWPDLAARVRAEAAFATLLNGGHAVLASEIRTLHLESRPSRLATEPPGTLLLVRDVTASRVAEQTIRTLFQFLQDRDEDRTRYLRRSSLAIEAERNRIARDLHDGTIQGVAAASLSLEAVKLMIDSGREREASEMVAKIRRELGEETENLRRLMSDLRPPLLEERGLVPAVRDLCDKFQEHSGINVGVRAACDGLVPSEIETIAYRVIQEALSNVAKHAGASNVVVRVESGRGVLEVEIQDDGCGFDASSLREFLRKGKVGLASMRERTELGSGTFTLRSRPDAGTTVIATLPVEVLTSTRT